MELRQLRYFVAVADKLHFTRAAAGLGIAQPPLSQQIRRLEHDLGVRLFDRTNRRVLLTEVGRAFLTEAKLTLAQADRAVDVARRARTSPGGRIVLGAQGSAEVIVFPRVLPRFLKRHPAVDVTVQSPLTPAEQVAMLRDGQIDVGFLRPPVGDLALVVVPILSEALVAALPMRHPLARRRSVTLQELAASTFVMFRRQNAPGMYRIIMEIWRAAGLKPKVLEDTMRMQTILSLIAVGRGVSLVPTYAMRLARQGVVFRPVRPALPKVGMAVAYNPVNTSPMVSAFLDVVEAVFRTRLPRSLPRREAADRTRDGQALRSS